jgi:hypothetical protein
MGDSSVKVVTGRQGLEVTLPVAWAFTGTIAALSMIGMVVVVVVVMVTTEITGVIPEIMSILEFVFGRVWLWIGLAVAVVLIAFDRFSNERYIFGARRVERQFRTGSIVTHRERYPLSWISDPQVEQDNDRYYVCWRWKGKTHTRRRLNRIGLAQDEAEAIARRISDWLDAPGTQTDPDIEASDSVWPLEWLLTIVSSRFGVAVPLLLGLTGALLLAQVWLLYKEIDSGGTSGLEQLQVSSGDLKKLQWVIDPATAYQGSHASVRLEAEISFEVEDTAHTLRLAARKFESMLWFESMYQRATEWFGPDSTRFIVPETTLAHLPIDSDWRLWSDLRWAGPEGRGDVPDNVLDLLDGMDRPWLYLVTRATTSRPELPVAFPPSRPDQAMPLAWYEAEREARTNVALPALAPLTLVAALLILFAVPVVLVQSLDRRRIARLLTLVFILAVPWWAGHAQQLPRYVGVDDLIGELTADLLRLHSPVRDHLWLTTIESTNSDRGMVVEWTLEKSGAYELITELGLTELARNHRWPDEPSAREEWQRAAAATFAALSNQALKEYAIAYGQAAGPSRFGELHRMVVEPAFCTQRPRLGTSFDYERFIDLHFRCQENTNQVHHGDTEENLGRLLL